MKLYLERLQKTLNPKSQQFQSGHKKFQLYQKLECFCVLECLRVLEQGRVSNLGE